MTEIEDTMFIMVGGFFSADTWNALAQISAAVTAWAANRASQEQQSEIDKLIEREQHPLRFAVKHPFRAAKRALRSL
jgi:hypothetical protein